MLTVEASASNKQEYKGYRKLVDSGVDGLVVYQETYDRDAYAELHTSGPKRRFDWRLECPELPVGGPYRLCFRGSTECALGDRHGGHAGP